MQKSYQKTIEELYQELNTSEKGLTNETAKARLKTYGQNVLIDKNKKTKLTIFLVNLKT